MAAVSVTEDIKAKAKRVRLLLLDVDGVLTDGKIVYDSSGRDLKFFDVHDGLGVVLLYKSGIKTILVSAKGSRAIRPRAKDMHIEAVFENASPKKDVLEKVLKKYNLDVNEICFMGDDLVDLCLMKRVGLPIAVFNACPEIKQTAAYITLREGGSGAVREVAELILKSQGKWNEVIKQYEI